MITIKYDKEEWYPIPVLSDDGWEEVTLPIEAGLKFKELATNLSNAYIEMIQFTDKYYDSFN